MRRLAWIALWLALQPGRAAAESAALVGTETPRPGRALDEVTAYGQAQPATQALRTLSTAQAGEVEAVLVTAGQPVRRGQPLLRLRTAPAAVASYRQAQTALSLARSQRLHTGQLFAQQLATRDQLAAADKAVADAVAQLAALTQDGAGRARFTLSAPFDALVVATPVAAGERPAAGAPLVTLARAAGLQVAVGVEPDQRGRVRLGQSVALSPVGGGPPLRGRVTRIDAMLNPRSRLVDVDVSVPAGAALSGASFRADIETGDLSGWRVPHAAVRQEDAGAFVFQVAAGRAHRVKVSVLQAGRDFDLVRGALDSARPLVTVGAYQLDDGAAVRTR